MSPESTVDQSLQHCRRSALHLKMRDGYMLDDPELMRWRHGHRPDPADHFSGRGDWIDAQTVTRPDVIGLCATAFEAVWSIAIPHEDYQPV